MDEPGRRRARITGWVASLLGFGCLAVNGANPLQAKPSLTNLEVYPPAIALFTANARQSLVVQATGDNGISADVTAGARFE